MCFPFPFPPLTLKFLYKDIVSNANVASAPNGKPHPATVSSASALGT
jgi:hypothetical protein